MKYLQFSLILMLTALCSCKYSSHTGPVTVEQAQSSGQASVRVTGIDVEQIHLDVSSSHPGSIEIPVGTVFTADDSGTQTMMTARTVHIDFSGDPDQAYSVPQTQSINLEVYCTNRMLAAPTPSSSFTIQRGGGELDPVRRLAACMENNHADHYTRQLAIWMSSERFLDLSEEEVRAKLHDHNMEMITSGTGLNEIARRVGIPPAQIQELLNDPDARRVIEEQVDKEAREEVSSYRVKTRPLLEQCNINTTNYRFFR